MDKTIVCDNFFTSLPLAEKLWQNNTKIIGTIRSNKPQLPACFAKNKHREEWSTIFAFQENVTAVSYVPKKNRVMRYYFLIY
jgi:hypothetical protein